ncbi:MAG TPA: response regulator [Thermoanaerobaculia bacterium]|jgi:DNA-binding NtrC family response regulator|nr:response regulator [Thermoanaerobaculia bacterium]
MNTLSENAAVLVIDPDPSIRTLIVALLRRNGYVAESAGDTDEALRLRRVGRHAAVILDPRVLGGDALLRALRSAGDDDAASPNLIVVTTPEQAQTPYAGRPGVHAVLFKPFHLNDLAAAVAECCGVTN